MEKVTLFENLLNATDCEGNRARRTTVTNFAALMGVDDQTVFDLLALYRTAIRNEASEMILGVGFGIICAADAARILDAAGVRSVLVDGDSTAALKSVHAFLSAGWQASATMISDDSGDRPALRLSRA